jgi:hypothetical protein
MIFGDRLFRELGRLSLIMLSFKLVIEVIEEVIILIKHA